MNNDTKLKHILQDEQLISLYFYHVTSRLSKESFIIRTTQLTHHQQRKNVYNFNFPEISVALWCCVWDGMINQSETESFYLFPDQR